MTTTTQRSRPGLLDRAGWLVALGTVVVACLPVPRAAAAETICVALVVDFSPLGGNVDSGCTRVQSGATGYDVLRAGGHTYEVCSNGVIGTIDGKPANGCQIKDNNHFWGYWHRKPGSRTWTFSSYGAGFYHPGEGSTEGWVWEDGTTKPPADVPYPADCHSPPRSASPTPATTHHSSPAASRSAAPTQQSGGSTNGAAQPARGATPRTAAPTARAHGTGRTPTRNAVTTSPTAAGPAPTRQPTAVAEPVGSGTTSGHAGPLLIGVAAAALLGAGAWWRFRKSGSS